MNGVTRKPVFCIYRYMYKNKDADQAIFCGCTALFVSDLVGNPEDRFSNDAAHMKGQSLTWEDIFEDSI